MKNLFLAGAILLSAFSCAPAHAADMSMCGPIQTVAQRLQDDYGEAGIVAYPYQDVLRLLFGNPETGTWTMVGMTLDGQACTLYDGDNLLLPGDEPAEKDPS